MALNKIYTRINWVNLPSRNTALDEINLNKMDSAINTLDDRIISLDTTKADSTALNNLVNSWTMDETTGVITITKVDGSQTIFDLNIEKIPVSFSMDSNGVITMTTSDGTKWTANISDMIPILTFNDSDEIAVSVSGSGKDKTYSFSIKHGSIADNKLRSDFLSDIRTESASAAASAESAATSVTYAHYYHLLSASYAVGNTGIREGENTSNAEYYKVEAGLSATEAAHSAENAEYHAGNASSSALLASEKAISARTYSNNASASAENASASAESASASAATVETQAKQVAKDYTEIRGYATTALNSSAQSKSYAIGTTGTRTGEDTDNAKYYYEQARSLAQSFSGALRPMGTVTFANLPSLADANEGDLYNISDEFTTTSDFKEGAGIVVSAGSNVYKTADSKWDVLSGSAVAGVKGNNESAYRTGNVNITASNIGALTTTGNSRSCTTTYTSHDVVDGEVTISTGWETVSELTSGSTHATLFSKISTMMKNVRWLYKMLGTADISAIGDGTVTGSINALNNNLPKTHVGMVIHSTTLDTEKKVIAIYGGTHWIQHSDYFLRGAVNGVTANNNSFDGGSDDAIIVKHGHTFTGTKITGLKTGNQSSNPTVSGGAHQHKGYISSPAFASGSSANGLAQYGYHQSATSAVITQTEGVNGHTHTVSGNHNHTVNDFTPSGTVDEKGNDGTNANIPKYKNVYIWECTAI